MSGRPNPQSPELRQALAEWRAGRRFAKQGKLVRDIPADASEPFKRGYLRLSTAKAIGVDIDAMLLDQAATQPPPAPPSGIPDIAASLPRPTDSPTVVAPPAEVFKTDKNARLRDDLDRLAKAEAKAAARAVQTSEPAPLPQADAGLLPAAPSQRCAAHREAQATCEVQIAGALGQAVACGNPVYRRVTDPEARVLAKVLPRVAASAALRRIDLPPVPDTMIDELAPFLADLSESFPLAGRWTQLFVVGALTAQYVQGCAATIKLAEDRARRAQAEAVAQASAPPPPRREVSEVPEPAKTDEGNGGGFYS